LLVAWVELACWCFVLPGGCFCSKAKQGEARRSKAKQGEARRSKAKQGIYGFVWLVAEKGVVLMGCAPDLTSLAFWLTTTGTIYCNYGWTLDGPRT
jgi:hypothetical protein